MHMEKTPEVRLRSTETQPIQRLWRWKVIDDHHTSLTAQGVQHGMFPDAQPCIYQPCPPGFNFGVSLWCMVPLCCVFNLVNKRPPTILFDLSRKAKGNKWWMVVMGTMEFL